MESHVLLFLFLYSFWGKLSFGQTDNFEYECSVLQRLENLENEVTKLKDQDAELAQQNAEFAKQDAEFMKQIAELTQQNEELAKQVQVVHCPDQRSYAFMAQLSQSLNNPASGHVVVFDDVITNVGGAYNNVHGIFKAPVNGTYTFTLVASFPNDADAFHAMHLMLKLNTNTVGYIFFDGTMNLWLRRTTTVVLHMNQNDELWTEVGNVAYNHALAGCCFHTHLSGFLVQAD